MPFSWRAVGSRLGLAGGPGRGPAEPRAPAPPGITGKFFPAGKLLTRCKENLLQARPVAGRQLPELRQIQWAEDREHGDQVRRSTPAEVTFTIVYLLQSARTSGIYEWRIKLMNIYRILIRHIGA